MGVVLVDPCKLPHCLLLFLSEVPVWVEIGGQVLFILGPAMCDGVLEVGKSGILLSFYHEELFCDRES